MIGVAVILLGSLSSGVADAFHLPSGSRVAPSCEAARRRQSLPWNTSERNNNRKLHLSKDDGDAGLTEEINALDTDLALEIEEALSLAQDALAVEVEASSPDEEEIDAIANMLLEKPPVAPPPLPAPPKVDPPASVVTMVLEGGADEDPPESPPPLDFGEILMKKTAEEVERAIKSIVEPDKEAQPLPPESPPKVADEDFGEILRKKTAEEIERIKNLIFGVKEELAEAESITEEAEDAAAALKKEIEDGLREREAMVKKIESEFAAEKELLDAQMGIASDELKVVMDQSARNITEAKSKASRAEKQLLSRIDSFQAAIDEVTAKSIKINLDKERIERSKQSMLNKAIEEGKKKLARFQKSFDFDINYAKQINADLVRRAEEAEGKVRDVYEQITRTRSERAALQQQITDVEKNALEEIEGLQRELKSDEERYATALQKERDRMDNVIEVAYQAYAIKVCRKIVERQAVEADYKDKLRAINMQIAAGREKQEARVKEYLDKLEEKHKKERVAIYQEKVEAVSAIRKQMNEELAVEYEKIEVTHKTMRAKIDIVRKQTSQLKAEFEEEMAKKRQLAKEEERELLSQIENVRVDMTDKMKTQRRLYDEQKAAYLEDMNAKISESEVELRQKWRELAGVKKSHAEVSAKRDRMLEDVAEKDALIDSYENDRNSFRKSLRLTARVAREKIGAKTRRLLKRDKEKAP